MPCLGSWGRSRNGLERFAKRVGFFLNGTERETLRLEIGVLDGQFQDRTLQRLILGISRVEFPEESTLVRVPQVHEDHGEVVGRSSDVLCGPLGFTCKVGRLLVGCRHHGAVRCVGGLREFDEEIRRETTRLGQSLEAAFATAAGRRQDHHGDARTADDTSPVAYAHGTYFLIGNWASSARLSSSTLTRGSPRKPSCRPSVLASTRRCTSASETPR